MRWLESRIFWGSLLILGGVIFLLQNLGILSAGELFWAILFGLAAVIFFSIFVQNRANWWALIPSITLMGISFSVALKWLLPEFGDRWSGSIVLAGIGLSFLVIYLIDRQNWWAVIPAGVLFTLAVVAGMEKRLPEFAMAGVFFVGLGLTFGLVTVLPYPQSDLRWAWIPAGILLIIGFVLLITAVNLLVYLLPVSLILIGIYIILRALRTRGS
jgi:hypothetical protein